MKEHKRLADEHPKDGQVCEVLIECPDQIKRPFGLMVWSSRKKLFHKGISAYEADPESIWWREKG